MIDYWIDFVHSPNQSSIFRAMIVHPFRRLIDWWVLLIVVFLVYCTEIFSLRSRNVRWFLIFAWNFSDSLPNGRQRRYWRLRRYRRQRRQRRAEKRGLASGGLKGAALGGAAGALLPGVSAKQGAAAGGLTGAAVGAIKKHNRSRRGLLSGGAKGAVGGGLLGALLPGVSAKQGAVAGGVVGAGVGLLKKHMGWRVTCWRFFFLRIVLACGSVIDCLIDHLFFTYFFRLIWNTSLPLIDWSIVW